MEVLALRSEDLKDMGETADAVKAYARSIDVSMGFLDRGILEELIIRV